MGMSAENLSLQIQILSGNLNQFPLQIQISGSKRINSVKNSATTVATAVDSIVCSLYWLPLHVMNTIRNENEHDENKRGSKATCRGEAKQQRNLEGFPPHNATRDRVDMQLLVNHLLFDMRPPHAHNILLQNLLAL